MAGCGYGQISSTNDESDPSPSVIPIRYAVAFGPVSMKAITHRMLIWELHKYQFLFVL